MKSIKLKINDLLPWCESLIKDFKEKQIVLLDGPLGAGKTELVKTFVTALGGTESSSPTYSLINEYVLKESRAYHVDLYRIESEEDLESIGFWDIFENKASLVFIEWSSRLKEKQLPLGWSILKIEIKKNENDGHRTYNFSLNQKA